MLFLKSSILYTDEVQDPAHSAVASAGQHSEIRNISEEIQPGINKVDTYFSYATIISEYFALIKTFSLIWLL